MLGSVSEHSKKNGSYIFTFKYHSDKDYKFKHFGVREYGTAAKAKAAAEAHRKKLQPELEKLSKVVILINSIKIIKPFKILQKSMLKTQKKISIKIFIN